MAPAITVDLRGYDFETHEELTEIVRELLPAIREDYPMVAICGLVISEKQLKYLRLDRHMHGVPAKQVKQQLITSVDGWPVTVVSDNLPVECLHDHLHDDDQSWYRKN
jgi:hypothetical protein